MATTDTPRFHQFDLVEGMQLQIRVTGSSTGRDARVELQLKNCSRPWILHWGCKHRGNMNWLIPVKQTPASSETYRQGALQTQFVKNGEDYSLTIQLQDPKVHAVEFVLKDGSSEKWLKLKHGNFCIEIPEVEASMSQTSIPKDLIERKAYAIWESKGKPVSSPQQQKQDYNDALKVLQREWSQGASLGELQESFSSTSIKTVPNVKEEPRSPLHFSNGRQNHGQRLQKHDEGNAKRTGIPVLTFMDLVEKYMNRDNVIMRRNFHAGNSEIVVLLTTVGVDSRIIITTDLKGQIVLHWGVSKITSEEWLAPSLDLLPENSKLVPGACQTYFTEVSTVDGPFQAVDINLQQRNFLGIQFIIWSGASWIKNNGANFFISLKLVDGIRKGKGECKGIVKWLLDEICIREKEAERSLMHRFSIATDLTERCKLEGELGLIGILVWMRFMSCRYLTWNKNYNVKPREISEAQEKFTNSLQRIYMIQPDSQEILRLILGCVGRGGQGDVGQRIRDEILVLQRNNNCKGGMMEEWHQKLHNNSSPDDVIICEALLDFVRSGFKLDIYWKTLNENGVTKAILASYDRPIVSEPRFRVETKDGLIRDLTSYLRTLKAVHSGADLESAIDTCSGSFSEGNNARSTSKLNYHISLSPKLQDSLRFVKAHIRDKNIGPLMEKLIESRIGLRPFLLTFDGKPKDILFLDLALDSAVKTTMERGLSDVNFANLLEAIHFISLVLENLCLSTVKNDDLTLCNKDWHRISQSYKLNDAHWALQAKAVLERLQLVIAGRSDHYQQNIQPTAKYLGDLLVIQRCSIDTFTEELIRSGSASTLSALISRLDPVFRKFANLGSWQVISPAEVRGFVVCISDLSSIQRKVFRKPTVIIANKVNGEEEIPDGVVAVLTLDMPDVLSHVSIRARNSKVCFATCFDPNIMKDLRLKQDKAISIRIRSTNLIISDINGSDITTNSIGTISLPRGVSLKKKIFRGRFSISAEEFTSDMVGAKSCNIQFLRRKMPSWISIPVSVALPFGVFERVLSEDINKDLESKISHLDKLLCKGDLSKLQIIQETVLQMRAPAHLVTELRNKMTSARIPWPGAGGEVRWNLAWQAIKKVWASKWNERAYISCRKANLGHGDLTMAVLVQEIISADYAFVIHTKNPLSGNSSEIYAEIVRGLGETLVGAYPGRAMSFTVKKDNLRSPVVTGYPSKQIGLFSKHSVIFRSDSNGEDLEGYAGAGLYDSVVMDTPEQIHLDYSSDRIIVDRVFQLSVFSKIAEAGKVIEDLYGCAQDIEGVVKDGQIHVVQTRPQI